MKQINNTHLTDDKDIRGINDVAQGQPAPCENGNDPKQTGPLHIN